MDLTIDDFTKSLNPREETQTLNTTKANKVNNDCTIKPLDINNATLSPFLSNKALVATVVPILIDLI